MLLKTITYKDFNGVSRTEDFYFHLSKAELTEMQLSTAGGLTERLKRLIAAKDLPAIIKIFKELILDSYGEKSLDGRRFVKSTELSLEFSQTEAYSILFMELATNDEAGAAFVNGIVPEGLAEEATKLISENPELAVVK